MEIKDALDIAERVGAWVLPAIGVAVAARKRIRSLVRAALLADSFHDHFGPDAAEAVRTIVDGLKRAQTISEIRNRIQERHLRCGIYVCGPDGHCLFANEWLAEAFGIDLPDMQGYGWLSAIESSDRERAVSKWKHCIENGFPYEDEYTVVNKRTGKTWRAQTDALSITVDGVLVAFMGQVVQKQEPHDSDLTRATPEASE